MKYEARPYQYAGASFLCQRSAILGYRVGLGKTWTTLLAVHQSGKKKILLICPKTLRYWWKIEMENYYGEIEVEDVGLGVEKITVPGGVAWYLTHYEQYINKAKAWPRLSITQWDVVICDEVHRIKNRKAQRTKNIKKLKSKLRWGLTGTPIADKPDDLWSLLHWVAPSEWRSYWTFVNQFCQMDYNPFSGSKQPRGLKKIDGKTDATLTILYRMAAPYLLVKSLEDVGVELPPVVISDVWLEMGNKQRRLYEQVQRQSIIDLTDELQGSGILSDNVLDLSGDARKLIIKSAGARFVRLQQVSSAPTVFKDGVDNVKLDWLKDYVTDGLSPAVIFTRFNHTADVIRQTLDDLGAEGFIVGTWAKLSEGHNFQHLDTMIAWDLPLYLLEWTQGLGRVDRPGQQASKVTVIRLNASDIDKQLSGMIDGKHDTATAIVNWLRGAMEVTNECS